MANGEWWKENTERGSSSMPINDYRDLEVWKRGMEIGKLVYQLTKELPREEQFGMTSQMRRASVSIPSNLAEGCCRQGNKEVLHFIRLAQGSLKEVATKLILSHEVRLTTPKRANLILQQTEFLGKQMTALPRSLRDKTD